VAWKQKEKSKGTSGNKDVLQSKILMEFACYRSCTAFGHRNKGVEKMRTVPLDECFHGDLDSSLTPATKCS